MIDRRSVLVGSAALAGCANFPDLAKVSTAPETFVRRDGKRLTLGGRPYRFVGANMWYAAYLGADAPYGDRARLLRELDALRANGVTNLRIMASSEDSPLKNSVKPTFRDATNNYNETLLTGLDFVLSEMAKRGMKAVLCLTNFWEWSGGMMTYLSYVNGGRYLDMNDPAHPWPEFPNFNAQFYGNGRAVGLYHDYVRSIVRRVNRITGRPYADDATIMSWQLANEPRPAGNDAYANLPQFYAWIDTTARLIKSLDANHLVSTGSEGLKGSLEKGEIVLATHHFPSIDYLTVHIWPNNWSWVNEKNLPSTYAEGERLSSQYIAQHVAIADRLNKPMVIEEFGYPRDGGSYSPSAPTEYKDRFYRLIYDAALNSAQTGGPIVGTNFWAWNGEARAAHPDYRFRSGDHGYMGDPPHEPQGWYGIFDTDRSTLAIVADHARSMAAID